MRKPPPSRQLNALADRLMAERGISRPANAREALRRQSQRLRPRRLPEVFVPGRGWVRTRAVDGRLVPDVQ
jgi:hypothetical protein